MYLRLEGQAGPVWVHRDAVRIVRAGPGWPDQDRGGAVIHVGPEALILNEFPESVVSAASGGHERLRHGAHFTPDLARLPGAPAVGALPRGSRFDAHEGVWVTPGGWCAAPCEPMPDHNELATEVRACAPDSLFVYDALRRVWVFPDELSELPPFQGAGDGAP